MIGTRRVGIAVLLLLVILLPSCATVRFAPEYNDRVINPAKPEGQRVAGYIHSRIWRMKWFKVLLFGETTQASVRHASSGGIGQIEDVDMLVEDYTVNPGAYNAHFGGFLPLLFGTECTYATVTYTK